MKTRDQIEAMMDVQVDCYLGKQVMGWTVDVASNCWIDDFGTHSPEWWNPSGCLDDAIKAAEKGLGGLAGFTLRCRAGGVWRALGFFNNTCCEGNGLTAARAVCNAVIAAHESKAK